MKVKDVLELILQDGKNTKTIAEMVGVNYKYVRMALRNAGCEPIKNGAKGWHYTGQDAGILEKDIRDFVESKERTKKKNEPKESKNVRSNDVTDKTKEEIIIVQREETSEVKRKRSSFDVEVDLLKELKILAIIEEKNVYEIVNDAIRDYLSKKNERR